MPAQGKSKAERGVPILKFWQGIAEVFLRSSVMVICAVTLMASSLGMYYIRSEAPSAILLVVDEQIKDTVKKSYAQVITESISATGLALGGALAVFCAETMILILRCMNFGVINYKIKIFLTIDTILSGMFAAAFFVCAVISANSASEWRRLILVLDIRDRVGLDIILDMRDTLAATATTSLLTTVLLIILFVWVVVYLSLNWNKKLNLGKHAKHHRSLGHTRGAAGH